MMPRQQGKPQALMPPHREGGMPLLAALMRRQSVREYSQRALPLQVLSDLLWAACGVNRPSGDRTAPCWRHVPLIEIFVAKADGVWIYDAKAHALRPWLALDLRRLTGRQDFAATAALDLVYVARGEHLAGVNTDNRRLYAAADCGFIGQNVYLFCASEGLATVFRHTLDFGSLEQALGLTGEQFVCFAQTVGYARE